MSESLWTLAGKKNYGERGEVCGFLLQTVGLVFRGFDFVDPLDLESSALVMIHNGVLAWRVEDTINPVLFLVVEYVVVGHAKLVFRGVLELLQLFRSKGSHRMTVDEFWHVETNFQQDVRVELGVSIYRELANLWNPPVPKAFSRERLKRRRCVQARAGRLKDSYEQRTQENP